MRQTATESLAERTSATDVRTEERSAESAVAVLSFDSVMSCFEADSIRVSAEGVSAVIYRPVRRSGASGVRRTESKRTEREATEDKAEQAASSEAASAGSAERAEEHTESEAAAPSMVWCWTAALVCFAGVVLWLWRRWKDWRNGRQ